jgi:hypothetical protein
MSLMRYTIVHDNGGVSFVGDEFMLPALVAACATNPTTYEALLEAAHEYDRRPRDHVFSALAVFDEHRIVQVHNGTGEVERNGRARHHNGRHWTARVHTYELPDGWRIVP